MAASSQSLPHVALTPRLSLYEKLNGPWHERALQGFMVIVLAHWAEHLVQAYQIYVMGWPRPKANGILGLWYPWLIQSEVLHYGYALVMLIGLWVLLKGLGAFVSRDGTFTAPVADQVFKEHCLTFFKTSGLLTASDFVKL